jgi:hypothetical protein
MRSWKFVLAGIIAAYLIMASAISIAVDYLASAPRSMFGQQERAPAKIAFFTEPDCMITQESAPTRITTPIAKIVTGFDALSWDLKGPNDIVSYALVRPCDDDES